MWSDTAKGLKIFDASSCKGIEYDFFLPEGKTNGYFPYVGDDANNKAVSSIFLTQQTQIKDFFANNFLFFHFFIFSSYFFSFLSFFLFFFETVQFIPLAYTEANLCNDIDLENCAQVFASEGLTECYNIPVGYTGQISSFQLISHDQPSIGLEFFDKLGCGGDSWELALKNATSGFYGNVGAKYDNRAFSCMFLLCYFLSLFSLYFLSLLFIFFLCYFLSFAFSCSVLVKFIPE
jgi:hypothetical protein